jgi:hypothetical protein
VSALGTPPTRVLRVDTFDANPVGFGLVLHEVSELPVGPLVELFDGWCTLSDMLQVLEGDVLAVVSTCFFANPVSDLMELIAEIP